jgi:DNA-binding NtrC family response regulator
MARPRVLLISGIDDARAVLQRLLENEDFEVVSSRPGSDALAAMFRRHFDVVITDLRQQDKPLGSDAGTPMHHVQPQALNIVLRNRGDAQAEQGAVVLADGGTIKSGDVKQVVELIRAKTRERKSLDTYTKLLPKTERRA